MTPIGYQRLRDELRALREIHRPKIVRDIEEARAHGDISENSEYEDAKHRQGLCEARVRDVETKLALAEVIDVAKLDPSDRVVFGVTVVLEDLESEEQVRYRIVGVDEADVRQGLISIVSPLARALVGKSIGDEIVVQVPGGTRRFAITSVEYE